MLFYPVEKHHWLKSLTNIFHTHCNLGRRVISFRRSWHKPSHNYLTSQKKTHQNPSCFGFAMLPSVPHQSWMGSSSFKARQKTTLQWIENIGQCLCCSSADIAVLVDMTVFLYTWKICQDVCSATAPCLVSPSERHRGLSIFQQQRVYHCRSDTPNAVSQTMRLIMDSQLQMKPHPAGKCTIHKLCRQERSEGNNSHGWWTC